MLICWIAYSVLEYQKLIINVYYVTKFVIYKIYKDVYVCSSFCYLGSVTPYLPTYVLVEDLFYYTLEGRGLERSVCGAVVAIKLPELLRMCYYSPYKMYDKMLQLAHFITK